MLRKQGSKRVERMDDLLRTIVSETLTKKIHHYDLEGVTITEVRVSPDLHHARVFYRVFDSNLKEKVAHSLVRVLPLIRRELGRELHVRYIPTLSFEHDGSLEYGNRIETLLESARKQGPKPHGRDSTD